MSRAAPQLARTPAHLVPLGRGRCSLDHSSDPPDPNCAPPCRAIMIQDRRNFESGCSAGRQAGTGWRVPARGPESSLDTRLPLPPSGGRPVDTICKSQESKLALIWTVGIFALNCGPVVMGFVLDYLGPKFTAILGGNGPWPWPWPGPSRDARP